MGDRNAGQYVTSDVKLRLRRDVYDRLMTERGATTVRTQLKVLEGISESTLMRMRRGEPPSLATVVCASDRLGTPISVLFERVEADQ